MAFAIVEELAKRLECAFCLDKFEEPKVLSCQHSYCRKCLERLIVRLDRENGEVTCPECTEKTKVPGGDVSRLPANFFINNLLSLHYEGQSLKNMTCAKHDGEALKLFCRTCDQPICRDCTVFDHPNTEHKYAFIKDIFSTEKQKVLQLIQQSKLNISALELSVEAIDAQENRLKENSQNVCQCIDSFVNAQIEMLKEKGEHLKEELKKLNLTQEENLQPPKDSLLLSLGCLKSGVEFTEQALYSGDEVAVLTTKRQLSQQLKRAEVLTKLKQPDTKFYSLEIDAPLNKILNETVRKMAYISRDVGGYVLSTYGGRFGHVDESYVDKVCHFVISKEKWKIQDYPCNVKKLRSLYLESDRIFHLKKLSRNNASLVYKEAEVVVEVRIKSPNAMNFQSLKIEGDGDGFLFSYYPREIGTYTIEVIVNGRYIHGCPFSWNVRGFVTSRKYTKMDDEE